MPKPAAVPIATLAAEFARLRPEHTSASAVHRKLAARYGLSEHTIRRRLNEYAPTPQPAHKTVHILDYVQKVDDFPVDDDTEKVAALIQKLRRFKRHVRIQIVSDEHFNDDDPRATTMNIRIAAYVQPDLIVFNGDTFDFSTISRFDQDRRGSRHDVLRELRKPYTAYVRGFESVAPNADKLLLDGNHNARAEAFANAAWQFGDTIEEAYADLVRCGGRVLWLNGKSEIDILNHHIMHGERTGENSAKNALEKDFGGAQSLSSGHTHGISKYIKRVKVPGQNRWIIVTSLTAGFAGNNPPQWKERTKNQIRWIQACQVVHVNPQGDDVHVTEIPYHEAADGSLIAVFGTEVFTVSAAAVDAQGRVA